MLVHKGGKIKNWGEECRDVTPTKLQSQNIFHFFVKYFIHHPLSANTSFKFLAKILFEIRHLQNFIPLFVKGP